MYRYGQYCPVARAAEILADRWTVLIVRELLADIDRFKPRFPRHLHVTPILVVVVDHDGSAIRGASLLASFTPKAWMFDIAGFWNW